MIPFFITFVCRATAVLYVGTSGDTLLGCSFRYSAARRFEESVVWSENMWVFFVVVLCTVVCFRVYLLVSMTGNEKVFRCIVYFWGGCLACGSADDLWPWGRRFDSFVCVSRLHCMRNPWCGQKTCQFFIFALCVLWCVFVFICVSVRPPNVSKGMGKEQCVGDIRMCFRWKLLK